MGAQFEWIYDSRGPKDDGDHRCLCTIDQDEMCYVGIAYWSTGLNGWMQNNAPVAGRVRAYARLPEPAKGHWVHGKLIGATDAQPTHPERK